MLLEHLRHGGSESSWEGGSDDSGDEAYYSYSEDEHEDEHEAEEGEEEEEEQEEEEEKRHAGAVELTCNPAALMTASAGTRTRPHATGTTTDTAGTLPRGRGDRGARLQSETRAHCFYRMPQAPEPRPEPTPAPEAKPRLVHAAPAVTAAGVTAAALAADSRLSSPEHTAWEELERAGDFVPPFHVPPFHDALSPLYDVRPMAAGRRSDPLPTSMAVLEKEHSSAES